MLPNNHRSAFTFVELLVAVMVSSILVSLTVSTYMLFRKGIAVDQARSDMVQNSRVAMDRLVRDLRQTNAVVTDLPDNPSDTAITQPHEIEFQDGNAGDMSYHRYYLNGTTLEMDTKYYYFAGQQGVWVAWNARDINNNPPSVVVTTQDIAQGVSTFDLYGYKPIEVDMTTSDSTGQSYVVRTYVTGRNL